MEYLCLDYLSGLEQTNMEEEPPSKRSKPSPDLHLFTERLCLSPNIKNMSDKLKALSNDVNAVTTEIEASTNELKAINNERKAKTNELKVSADTVTKITEQTDTSEMTVGHFCFILDLPDYVVRALNAYSGNKSEPLMTFFVFCCSGGRKCVALYLWLNYKKHIYLNARNDIVFYVACVNGQIKTAKWLLDIAEKDSQTNTIDIFARGSRGFEGACINGCDETAEWLYSLHEEQGKPVDFSAIGYKLLCNVCARGWAHIASWLQNLYYVDVTLNDDLIFRNACAHGKLTTANWIYKTYGVKTGMNYRRAYPLRHALYGGHVTMAIWLVNHGSRLDADEKMKVYDVMRKKHISMEIYTFSKGVNDVSFYDDYMNVRGL
jgi:hypothetical protein